MNIRIGKISKWLTPELAQCGRCCTTWGFVTPRVVRYGNNGHGCFALCTKCWNETTPDARLPYFYAKWQQHWYNQTAWAVIRDAVARAT